MAFTGRERRCRRPRLEARVATSHNSESSTSAMCVFVAWTPSVRAEITWASVLQIPSVAALSDAQSRRRCGGLLLTGSQQRVMKQPDLARIKIRDHNGQQFRRLKADQDSGDRLLDALTLQSLDPDDDSHARTLCWEGEAPAEPLWRLHVDLGSRLGGSLALSTNTLYSVRCAADLGPLTRRFRDWSFPLRSCHHKRRQRDAIRLGPGDLLGIREAATLLPALLRRFAAAPTTLTRKRLGEVFPVRVLAHIGGSNSHRDRQHHQQRRDQQHNRCQPSASHPISEVLDH